MTLNDAIISLYEGTDEQSDRVPYNAIGNVDLTLEPTIALVSALDAALKVVSTWRCTDGRKLRFRACEGESMWLSPSTGREEDAIQGDFILDAGSPASPTRIVNLPARFAQRDNYYRGWVIELGGLVGPESMPYKTSIVLGSVGSVLTLVDLVTSGDMRGYNLPHAPFTLHPRCVPLDSLGLEGFISLRSVADMNSKNELTYTKDFSYGLGSMGEVGTPTAFFPQGDWLYFDIAPSASRAYLLRYWKYPSLPGSITGELPLPNAFHEAIVLIAKWMEFRRIGQTEDGLECWRGASELLNRMRTDEDFERDSYNGTMTGRIS